MWSQQSMEDTGESASIEDAGEPLIPSFDDEKAQLQQQTLPSASTEGETEPNGGRAGIVILIVGLCAAVLAVGLFIHVRRTNEPEDDETEPDEEATTSQPSVLSSFRLSGEEYEL